jgi:hypothetical protein
MSTAGFFFANVSAQYFGDGHAAVFVLVILQNSDKGTTYCHSGRVVHVYRLALAICPFHFGHEAAGLKAADVV